MKRNLIGNAWATFERVLPADAPDIQKQEMRRAFYGGAQALLGGLLKALEPGGKTTEGDLATIDGVNAELKRFAEDVLNGKA